LENLDALSGYAKKAKVHQNLKKKLNLGYNDLLKKKRYCPFKSVAGKGCDGARRAGGRLL
jgi:hypothetical protein